MNKIDLNNLDKSTWEPFRFEEIASKVSETVDPNKTDIPIYIGLEHIDADDIHIRRQGTPDDVNGQKLKCYPGDVIFGKRRAYQRKAAIVDFEGICSAHAFVLRANPEVIDPQLFPFFLHSDQFMHRMVDISVGGLSPTINWGDLKHQEFLLPPKDQQAQLAELLWAMDEVIEREKELIESIEKYYIVKLNSLFWKNDGNLKKVKFGFIPHHWSLVRLEDVCIKIGDGIHATPKYVDFSDYKFINGNNIINGQIHFNERTQCVSATEFNKLNLNLKKETILMSINGTIGNLGFYNNEKVILGKSVAYITTMEDKLSNEYLYFLIQTKKVDEFYKRELTGTTISNLSLKSIRNTPVPLPPLNEQKEIANISRELKEVINETKHKLINSQSLQKSLINQVF